MKNKFLPEGNEFLKTEKSYWKPSQMTQGDNKFRIVMQVIGGWEDWIDKKPIRYKPNCKPAKSATPDGVIKRFWACYVWDYDRESLFVLEFTQTGIIKALNALGEDENWGDFTQYDIKINKKGSGLDTEYSVTPCPHKPMTDKIKDALKRSPVRLEALFDGGDPWTDLEPKEEASSCISFEQVEHIERLLANFPESRDDFLKWMQVVSIETIQSKDYERAVKAIHDKIKKEGVA